MPPDEPDDLRSDIMKAFEADGAEEPSEGSPQPLQSPPSAPSLSEPEAGAEAGAHDTQPRPRDAQGRFIAQQQEIDQAVRGAQLPGAPAPGPQEAAATTQARQGPPPGWSIQGKAAYDKLPDAVKADIAKREVEVSQGLAKLAEYRGLDDYVQMARNANTTLPEALARYVNAENALEAHPVNGILWLCQRYRVHPAQLLEAVQGNEGNQTPEGYQQPAREMDPRMMGQIQAVDQRLAMIEQERENQEHMAISGQIQSFAQDPAHKWFENVRGTMAEIIRAAPQNVPLTLEDVYIAACNLTPQIRDLMDEERLQQRQNGSAQRAAQIRRSAASLPPGSPVTNGEFRSDQPAPSLREEISRAMQAHRV